MDEIINRKTEQAAIVGIGCMFAKSADTKAFLRLLMRGTDGISDPPPSHEKLIDLYDQDPKKPDHIYCNRGGFLPQVDFDPTEFGIPPHAIEATDTSQLLGLLTARQALDDAGYGEEGKTFDRTRTSVILGVTGTQELVIPLGARLGHPIWRRALAESGIRGEQAEDVLHRISEGYVGWQENSFPGLLGNVVAGRIANRLDLGGTNCVVDAACASSMGALHTALLELGTGRSDMVVTGGVDTINDAFMHMCFAKTQILSASGDIRPFSQKADGTVLGEGIGMMVLKRLEDARCDGDRIYAVIRGVGSASDGKSQSIYAPRPEGQAMALKRAYQQAGVSPAEVALIEAHGTGTRVGDQVEFNALCDVFKADGTNGQRCALGSVKSNIGHTKAAAGIAGMIKTAMALYHKILPPTLKAEPVDAKLKADGSPFYINTRLRPWVTEHQKPRRAGVSAFGFGGSNFHAVLEEADAAKAEASWDGSVEILSFSGATKQALISGIDDLLISLENKGDWQCLGPLAAVLRKQFKAGDKHRLVVGIGIEDGLDGVVRACTAARVFLAEGTPLPSDLVDTVHYGNGQKPGGLAFLFPGQGSQYTGMARDLVCAFPGCLSAIEGAGRIFEGSETLTDLIYPHKNTNEASLRPTWIAQPAIGAASVAMLEALSQFGVKPDATCGHSYGELVALHAAGWLDRDALWKLTMARGNCMAEAGRSGAEPGTMLAVSAPLKELEGLCREYRELVLANRNSPDQGVLSGSTAAIGRAREICNERGWTAIALPVSAAFHSPFVADASEPFAQAVNTVSFTPGPIEVMSNTLGKAYPQSQHDIRRTLSRHIKKPVDFIKNISCLYDNGIRTFVEIGPRTVLSRLTKTILRGQQANILSVDSSAGKKPGLLDLAAAISRLAALGYPIDLLKWEKPDKVKRRPKMIIPLSGANYRSPRREKVKAAQEKSLETKAVKMEQGRSHDLKTRPRGAMPTASPQAKTANPAAVPKRDQKSMTPLNRDIQMKNDPNPKDNKGLQAALVAVQQGLASLQALQAQTAHAHEKFLETQSEASRTLRDMLQSAQQLTGFTGSRPVIEAPAIAPLQPPAPVPAEDEPHFADNAASPAAHIPRPAPMPPQTEPVEKATQDPMPEESNPGIDPTTQKHSRGRDLRIQSSLIAIVSELTGYPEEMLGLQMDIEADLGIDSIKRVEILSALEERMPELPKVTPDLMGTLKTLGQICEYLGAATPENGPSPSGPKAVAEPEPATQIPAIQRRVVEVRPSPAANRQLFKPADGCFLVVAGPEDRCLPLVQILGRHGLAAEFHSEPEALANKDKMAGLVLMAPMEPMTAFSWARSCGAALQKSDTCFITVSQLDGAFGFGRKGLNDPRQGAMAGLSKTAALEWPGVRCCAIDVAPEWQDHQAALTTLADEIRFCNAPSGAEIGLSPDRRVELALKTEQGLVDGSINLDTQDVAVVSGGARGVTAAAAKALADHTRCRLALIGRSPRPHPEPLWLQAIQDEAEIKKALIQHQPGCQDVPPKALEEAYRAAMANRAVLRSLDDLRAAGHMVEYFSLDVCDAEAVKQAMDDITSRLGPVKAIIHGAGVLEDRLIVDKTNEQWQRVYNTKVHGFQNLLQTLDQHTLRYLVLFSSVSARLGNQGQSDYAMANEVLNKNAVKLAADLPKCKVVSLNWGPWDGGMVTAALKRNFSNRGIPLIPLQQGTQAMLAEMASPLNVEVEVVLGASLDASETCEPASPSSNTTAPEGVLNLSAKREIDVERVPVLQAHQLDGRPVVPFALITEWLAHSALHANPGLALHGLDNLRLCKGIVLDKGGKMIRLMAGNAKRNGQTYEVDVEIRNGVQDGIEVVHSRAKAILTDQLPSAPPFTENGHFKSGPGRHSLEEIYSRILFHGKELRGIKQVIRLAKDGMTCLISAAPKPDLWMTDPLRSRWIADPLVLDSAFQMAIVWCYDQMGLVCLPSYAMSYRQYQDRFPLEGVSAVMEIQKASTRKMVGDFTFLNGDKTVVARLEGYEAVIDKDLIQAFKGRGD